MYQNLRAEIARAGMSNAKVADKLGIDRCTFSAKVTGQRDWKFEEVCKIKKLLGTKMPLEVLFDRGE